MSSILSHVPGRVRLACDIRFDVSDVLRLEMTPGVHRAHFNPVTCTVLIHYHPHQIGVPELLAVVRNIQPLPLMLPRPVPVPTTGGQVGERPPVIVLSSAPTPPRPTSMSWQHILRLVGSVASLLWAESLFGLALAAWEVVSLMTEVRTSRRPLALPPGVSIN